VNHAGGAAASIVVAESRSGPRHGTIDHAERWRSTEAHRAGLIITGAHPGFRNSPPNCRPGRGRGQGKPAITPDRSGAGIRPRIVQPDATLEYPTNHKGFLMRHPA